MTHSPKLKIRVYEEHGSFLDDKAVGIDGRALRANSLIPNVMSFFASTTARPTSRHITARCYPRSSGSSRQLEGGDSRPFPEPKLSRRARRRQGMRPRRMARECLSHRHTGICPPPPTSPRSTHRNSRILLPRTGVVDHAHLVVPIVVAASLCAGQEALPLSDLSPLWLRMLCEEEQGPSFDEHLRWTCVRTPRGRMR